MTTTITTFQKEKSEIRVLVREFLHIWRSVFSAHVLMLFVISIVMSGCGGETSPTGPDAVRNIQEGKAVAISHNAVLHAILVVDTNATGSVGEALDRDLEYMSTLVDNIATYTDMRVDKQVFSGHRATKALLDQALDAVSAGPDDVILFYFSGHGGRTRDTETQWPDMYLQNAFALNLNEVFNRLNSKGSRLLLALGDSCNGSLDDALESSPVSLASLRGRSEGYRTLFLEGHAAIIASSSVSGELSYMQAGGSLFTRQFLQAFSTEISSREPDWKDLMNAATRHLRVSDVEQQPQYLIY